MNIQLHHAQDCMNEIIRGKETITTKVFAAILAGGHILLEDVPGVGKTTLAIAVSKILNLNYHRIQFTPDILPSDITGFSMYNANTKEFEYKPGAAMTNLLLADEINRTSPKTQSALLEIMEEKCVTVDGITHPLPTPFIVIATENPFGSSGTQMLPESQLDRFMICTSLGYPSHRDSIDILKNHTKERLSEITPFFTSNELLQFQKEVTEVYVSDVIFDYIVSLTEATRTDTWFSFGASPRASLALLNMAKSMAYISDRDYVIPQDIISILPDVFGHRVQLSHVAKSSGKTMTQAMERIIDSVALPATTNPNRRNI